MIQPTGVDAFSTENMKRCREYVLSMQCELDNAIAKDEVDTIRSIVHRMVKSQAVRLVAVDTITRINDGKHTAGIDGVALPRKKTRDAQKKWRWELLQTINVKAKPSAIRRVYIPKANGKKRPLGIPTVHDRVVQAIIKMAIEPICEFHFDDRSHGFRPNRCTMDAMTDVWQCMSRVGSRTWVLEGDIKSCFDNLDHQHILDTLSEWRVPQWTTGIIERMLKSKVMENWELSRVEDGTPQGGVISPLLANVALDALDKYCHENSQWKVGGTYYRKIKNKINPIIRYADDFVLICKTKQEARDWKQQIIEFLPKIGVELSAEKTAITHIKDGFDFLGFHVRRWENKGRFQSNLKGKGGTTLLIKPSVDKIQRHKDRFKELVKSSGDLTQAELIKRLNTVIRGFTNYYRHVSSKQIFHDLEHYHWHTLHRWARRRHRNKHKGWVTTRYFHQKDSHKAWFGDIDKNLWILHPDRVTIVRHPFLERFRRVYNSDDAEYWTEREVKKTQKVVDSHVSALYKKQKGHCEVCGDIITKMDIDMKWTHTHHIKPRAYGGDWKLRNLRLIHSECHKELHGRFKLKEMSDLADAGEEYWVLNHIFV